jgi:hypothetical protein
MPHDKRLAGKLFGGMCGQNALRVDVDGVATRRLDDLNPRSEQLLAEVLGAAQAVLQVIFVHDFFEALRHRFQIAPGQSAVGDKAFGQDEQIRPPCESARRHAAAARPPMFTRPSFLALIVAPSARSNMSRTISAHGAILLAGLALLDEPRIFGKAARVEEQRQVVLVADRPAPARMFRG